MKKNIVKRVLASVISATMIFSMPMGMYAADEVDEAGDVAIEVPEVSDKEAVALSGNEVSEDNEAVLTGDEVSEADMHGSNPAGVTVGNPYKHPTKTVTYDVYDENGNTRDETNKATVWDCVWFGHYWQDCEDTSGIKTPIKWRVLSVKGNDALIMADMGLDAQPYNTTYTSITWKDCTLRSWLNNDFYNNAFSSQNKSAIISTSLVNDDNPYYGTEGGENTTDNVFLLSIADSLNADYGFDSTRFNTSYDYNSYDPARRVKPTTFAKARGATILLISGEYANCDEWWLRSPGLSAFYAASVSLAGSVKEDGRIVDYTNSVRPALHLDLSSPYWEAAGTVCSDGTIDETATTGLGGSSSEKEEFDYAKDIWGFENYSKLISFTKVNELFDEAVAKQI